MTAITYVDLNELEAGQENWLAVIARERAEAKKEEHKRRLIADAPARYREYERKKKRQKFLQLAGLKFEESEHPRDESGRFTSGGGTSGGESFVSPNKDESTLSLDEASQRLHSERQQKLKATFDEIDKLVGADASGAVGAVGAWADGAENSTITIYKGTDYETIRAAGSMKGLLAEQKAVLTFKYDSAGDHAMLSATFKGSLQDVHEGLSKAGVEFHTLVPKGDSVEAHVFGNSEEVGTNFQKYIEDKNGTERKVTRGHGDFIGSWDSREEGAKAYEEELDRYFSRAGMEGRNAEWRRLRDNWRQAALKAFEFIQFTKSLETKIARAAVKAAAAAQHTRVEKQAAKAFAAYFQKSVASIVSKLPKSFKPDPENAKEQAASLIKRAFKSSKQNDLLISSMSQPVADAFLEGAYAELRLQSAAKRRKKGYNPDQPRNPDGTFSSGGGTATEPRRASSGVETIEWDEGGSMNQGGFKLHALRNPSLDDAKAKLKNSKYGELRGLVESATRNVWLWDAEKANHDQVADKLGLDWYGDIIPNNGRLHIKSEGQLEMVFERLESGKELAEFLLKFNPNHDETGRFASGDSGGLTRGKYTKDDSIEEASIILDVPYVPGGIPDSDVIGKAAGILGIKSGQVDLNTNRAAYGDIVEVAITTPQFIAKRIIDPADKRIKNDALEVTDKNKGTGTEILANEVAAASAAGYETLETFAAGGPNTAWNGYYTWPRLGFDAPLFDSDGDRRVTRATADYANQHGLKNVSDFMKTAEHRQWWKSNGEPLPLEFDLREGSQSRKVLEAYVQAKREQQSASGKSTGDDSGGRRDPGQDLGLAKQHGVKITTATQAARRAEQEIEFATTAPDWLTEAAQDFIIETFQEDYWLRIPETTRDDIELTLYNAIRDGKSIRDIAQEIQDAHGDEYSKYRALNVARTEMTGAMNAGATESISQAFEGTGITPTKVWLSVLGPTTRDEHAEADGQEVLLDAQFTVGGEQCSYPGDIVLSPHMRCNCQCSLISGEVESQISDEEDGKAFDPDQPRDESGRWTSEGGSSTIGSDHATESPKKPPLERTVADFHAPNPTAKTSADKYKQDGKYTAERLELHQAIIAKELAGHKASSNPTMYLVGGGTASGKSTALASGEFKIPDDVVHIDSDAIKAQLPDYKEMLAAGDSTAAVYVHSESSKIGKELIGETARKKYDGIVDTTGDNGLAYLEDKVAEMRQSGHLVVANYVTVDVDTAIARSNKRGAETGRVVPEELIRTIHKSVSEVLPQAVSKGLFDEVTLWDTNTGTPVKVMSAGKGQVMTVHDQNLWQKFLDKAK